MSNREETRQRIMAEARAAFPDMVRWRRAIHENPEASYCEAETAALAARELYAMGAFEVTENVGGHGVIAKMKGGKSGPSTALRADMDALHVEEETGLPFASKKPGLMHACGHDMHTAMLLGAAKVIAALREEVRGDVTFVFQPAEEVDTGGGSRDILESGALSGIDRIFGIHVWPELKSGTLMSKDGAMMASSDHFEIEITGRSGHGAQPQNAADAIAAGAAVYQAIQTIVSRGIDPQQPAVVTVGKFNAGTRYNVIAGKCVLEGTCRTFDPAVRERCHARLREIAEILPKAYGCEGRVEIARGNMPLINDAACAALVRRNAAELFGAERVTDELKPSMCAEDFSYYLSKIPGAFIFLGATREGEQFYPLHSSRFAPPEEIMEMGAALHAGMVMLGGAED